MSLLCFRNSGEMDIRLAITFGANVKEGGNPIGYFGTGLKYAIAIALREGGRIQINSGLRQYTFRLAPVTLRGKEFQFIEMTGPEGTQQLGFTSEQGKDWEPWQAYRELYCNALDEGGGVEHRQEAPQPAEGETQVLLWGKPFLDVHWQRDQFILPQGTPLFANHIGEIYHGAADGVFYRGILVAKTPLPSLYTYNITQSLRLTENRTVADDYEMRKLIGGLGAMCTERAVADRITVANQLTYEGDQIDYDWGTFPPSMQFLDAVEEHIKHRESEIVHSARQAYRKARAKPIQPELVTLNSIQQQQLDKATEFCSRIGVPITYPVKIARTLGPNILGRWRPTEKEIWLAEKAFETGTKCVAGTLLEEQLHATTGAADMTRQLQNILIDKIISMGEMLQGRPI